MRNCPVCREALAPATFGGITLEGCHRCGGVWFDRGELTRMARGDLRELEAVDRAFEAGPAASTQATGPCPQCGATLVTFEPPQAAGLKLLGCSAGHGVWLREQDFEAIAERVEQWRAQRVAAAPAASRGPEQRFRSAAGLLLSRPCPRCEQPNATASPLCWACGARLNDEEAGFRCPTCDRALDAVSHEGIALNHCGACGGLWLDYGELGRLIRLPHPSLAAFAARMQPASPAPPGVDPAALACPACDGEVRRHEYAVHSGIFIRSCRSCNGVWLDPECLVPIQEFVQRSETFLPPQPT